MSVAESQGIPIANLERQAFELRENDQPITNFRVESIVDSQEPLAVALVIDTSESMGEEERLAHAKSAASSFIDTLGPRDSAAVVSFANDVRVVQGYTSDRGALKDAVTGMQPEGATALYDALLQTAEMQGAAATAPQGAGPDRRRREQPRWRDARVEHRRRAVGRAGGLRDRDRQRRAARCARPARGRARSGRVRLGRSGAAAELRVGRRPPATTVRARVHLRDAPRRATARAADQGCLPQSDRRRQRNVHAAACPARVRYQGHRQCKPHRRHAADRRRDRLGPGEPGRAVRRRSAAAEVERAAVFPRVGRAGGAARHSPRGRAGNRRRRRCHRQGVCRRGGWRRGEAGRAGCGLDAGHRDAARDQRQQPCPAG